MKFIHTADWHLGQTLLGQPRVEEQKLALDWLLQEIERTSVDGLIVSGDIFDVASPAEDARKLYYDFLARLAKSAVEWVVVVAGNHDSPRMISNIDALAKAFNIHIVAAPSPPEFIQNDLIEVRAKGAKKLSGVIAAVPFLHDRFVRKSAAHESLVDKEEALAAGIHAHFKRLAAFAKTTYGGVPIVATGHLYASGALARSGQDNIYVGNIRNINAAELPSEFDYVALGHIHRPQALKGANHVRYSGSLIPLDFKEGADEKGIWIVNIEAGNPPSVEWSSVPIYRRLKQITGTLQEAKTKLIAFGERHQSDALGAWIDVSLKGEGLSEMDRAELREIAATHNARILKISRQRSTAKSENSVAPLERLDEITVEEVFERKLKASQTSGEIRETIYPLFKKVLDEALVGKTKIES